MTCDSIAGLALQKEHAAVGHYSALCGLDLLILLTHLFVPGFFNGVNYSSRMLLIS